MKYVAYPFKVQIVWFENYNLKKRVFRKYLEAIAWAEKNITAEEIFVKISGTVIRREN